MTFKSKHAKKASGTPRTTHLHSSETAPPIRFKVLSLYPLNSKSSVLELRARKGRYVSSSQLGISLYDSGHGRLTRRYAVAVVTGRVSWTNLSMGPRLGPSIRNASASRPLYIWRCALFCLFSQFCSTLTAFSRGHSYSFTVFALTDAASISGPRVNSRQSKSGK